jgi:ubiquinone/menaquinone biosynthesis C-methylase UbiE
VPSLRSLVVPPRRFDPASPEMIDMPGADPGLLRDELKNLRIINRRFGGRRAVRDGLLELARGLAPGAEVTLLDLGAGSGDHAVEAARVFRSLGRTASITAVDNNAVVLAEARAFTSEFGEIMVEEGDLRSLPFRDAQFDIVLCSLTAHHFTDADAVALLREMRRLSRVGFLLLDLDRSYLALAAAWLYTRATTTNIMTRTDAIASIRAAFTGEELAALARSAGMPDVRVTAEPLFLLRLLHRRNGTGRP